MARVKVDGGELEGEILENEYGKPYYSFKGIPYAEPPIGDLRFKAPVPVKPWKGVRPAKEFGSICYQRDYFEGIPPPNGTEDCLFINVYSPNLKPAKPLPVMFWIHGGGFIWGSGNDNMYGPEFLIRHDVLLVTFNYRLGAFGFLCLDTKEVPGNAGMKDQVLALKWVNKNISKFGGDPNNVTIFGESAGGSSVSYHLVSPMSKGLFKRAIVQSASSTSFWCNSCFHRERAIALARQLGFYSENSVELYDFFKKQPTKVFLDQKLPVTLAKKLYGEIDFTIVSEKDFGDNEMFFHGDIFESLRNGIHEGVEVIVGYTEHEGIIGLSFNDYHGHIDTFLSIANDFVEFFVPKRMAVNLPLSVQLELGKKVKNFYIKDGTVSRKNIDELLNFINMDFFCFDTLTGAKFISKKNKTYVYKFTCKSERNQMTKQFALEELFKGRCMVSHADDLAYLFPVKLLNQKIDKNSKTFQLIDNVTKLWSNFAKFGNPTPDGSLGAQWSPYTMDDEAYLDIGNELVSKSHIDEKDIKFWESLYKEYLPRYSV